MSSCSRVLAVAVLIVLVATCFVSASSNASGSVTPRLSATTDPTSFVYATIGEPYCLDPAVEYVSEGVDLLLNMYETLVWYDGPRADVLVPVLATEVPTVDNGLISPDGLTYTLHIKPGVMFHDGTPLTADDVVYSVQRVLRIHDMGGPSWMLEQVLTDYVSYYLGSTLADYLAASYNAPWITAVLDPLGADHVITEADVQAVAEVAVVKVDEMTVAFRLTHAYPAFVPILASPACSIVSKDYVESHGGVVNGEQSAWMNMHTCGTGPYVLDSWELGASISLKRFDGYHGALPALVDVTVVYVNDIDTRLLMLEAGTADSIYLPSNDEYKVAGNPDITVVKGIPTFTLEFAAFNLHIDSTNLSALYGATITGDFFADLHMRKAFAHLVDYASMIQYKNGNAMQPNGPIPIGMLGYDPTVPVYTYDLAAAQAELELAINPSTGNSWWTDGFTLPLFFNAGNLYRQTFCEGIKAGLESFGPRFAVIVVALDWPTYVGMIFSNPSMMPMRISGWAPDYADPDNYATTLLDSTYGYFAAFSGYSNPAVDSLVRQAAAELDPAVRIDLYSQVSWLAHDDVPYLWLTQDLSFQVMRSWVVGYYYNPMHSSLYFPSLSKVEPPGIDVMRGPGNPAHSARTWTFRTALSGTWSLKIENNGLAMLSIEVRDLSTGQKVAKQQVSFNAIGAYPTGTVITDGIKLSSDHEYQITVTPNGQKRTSAVVRDVFKAMLPPIASFTYVTDNLLVSVDGTGSYDPDGTVVAWMWDWGDGSTDSGATASHTYGTAGTYVVALIVTDDDGSSGTMSEPVWVVAATAEFAAPHADHGFDSDSDGLYDYLVIEASVSVSTAGYYNIMVWLASSSWNWIASAGKYTYLDSGLQTVEVLLAGYKIQISGIDGPYYASLELYDEMFYFLDSDMFTTQAYSWAQFQAPPAELAPPHSDMGLDVDSDWLYDYLVIDVSVSVSVAGYYSFNTNLYDSLWNYVAWASNYTYLQPGLQTVQLLIGGPTIYSSGFDGPYLALLDLYDAMGNLLDSEWYTTQAYTWNQFQP